MVDEIEDIFIDPLHRPGAFYRTGQQDSMGKSSSADSLGTTLYKPSVEGEDS